MPKKPLLFTGVIILIMGGFYFLYYSTHSPLHPEEPPGTAIDGERLSGETVASLRKKYPHLQPPSVEWFERLNAKPTHTWEEWIDANVELALNQYVFMRWNEGNPLPWVLEAYDTPAKLAAKEASFREWFERAANSHKERDRSVPATTSSEPLEYLQELQESAHTEIYEGPQTTEAIMEEFDDFYSRIPTDEKDFMDTTYPRETWIQDFLNKGAQFKDAGDYDTYLDSRRVLMNRSNDPSLWASGQYGIRPSSTLDEYKDAFIEREIWIQNTWNRVREEHPDTTGMAIEGEHYLPFKDNLTYVRRNGPSTVTWGTMLSDEGMANLTRGIEPEGIEIVYIDEDYNITEKPPPWDPKSPDAKARTEKALKEIIPGIRILEDSDVPVRP